MLSCFQLTRFCPTFQTICPFEALGEFDGAKAAFERALAIDEAVYGPDHPNVGIRINNLGLVLHALGDLAAARAAHERALVIFERHLPPDHPNLQITKNNIAYLESRA